MAAITEELALRYLLELSTDIRVAFLVDEQGGLVASAPEPPPERIARVGAALAREANSLAAGGEPAVEIDVSIEGGCAFLVWEGGPAMVCVTGPFALPGLILHDMRIALADLRRGEPEEGGRA
jgi:hypothetical protein